MTLVNVLPSKVSKSTREERIFIGEDYDLMAAEIDRYDAINFQIDQDRKIKRLIERMYNVVCALLGDNIPVQLKEILAGLFGGYFNAFSTNDINELFIDKTRELLDFGRKTQNEDIQRIAVDWEILTKGAIYKIEKERQGNKSNFSITKGYRSER